MQGGYEDSDFCLRLIELGRQNWYMPGAELYHLEAQSYTSERRKLAGEYNVWLHTHRWNDRIEEVSKEHGPPPRPEQGLGARRALAMTPPPARETTATLCTIDDVLLADVDSGRAARRRSSRRPAPGTSARRGRCR